MEHPSLSLPRWVAHVDMDAFYVSVELQRRPELRGKPVVIAGSGPRAVVTTASYEARKFGVFSAIPASRARRRCPEAIFLPPDFETYRARSGEVMQVLREHVEVVEVMGLDEAYLELTGYPDPLAKARDVKAAVADRTGLGCSIGIGPNKLVAKVASDADKPDGFLALTREEACARFASASPRLLPGIGPKTDARLSELGIRTLAELAATSEEQLCDWFGENCGSWLARIARFHDDSPLVTEWVAKSESRETTFDQDISDFARLEQILDELCDDLCTSLAEQERRGRTISIKIRLSNFSTYTRARTIPEHTNDRNVVRDVAVDLLRVFDPRRPVRLLGVRVARFEEDAQPAAADLFVDVDFTSAEGEDAPPSRFERFDLPGPI